LGELGPQQASSRYQNHLRHPVKLSRDCRFEQGTSGPLARSRRSFQPQPPAAKSKQRLHRKNPLRVNYFACFPGESETPPPPPPRTNKKHADSPAGGSG
jgi:hypothetical protein